MNRDVAPLKELLLSDEAEVGSLFNSRLAVVFCEAAADSNSESAEGGRIILSPGREVFWWLLFCCGDFGGSGNET